jgi:hypothetical protein
VVPEEFVSVNEGENGPVVKLQARVVWLRREKAKGMGERGA